MLFHLSLRDAEVLSRPYGVLYRLTPDEAGFKNLRMHIIVINPGQRTSKHYHPVEEIFFILEGSGIFIGADEEFRVKERDAVLVPPNEVHQLWNDNAIQKLKYLVAMSPPRDPSKVVYVK